MGENGELIGEVYGKKIWLTPSVLKDIEKMDLSPEELKKLKHQLIDKLARRVNNEK